MNVCVRESIKFDATKTDLSKSWTVHASSSENDLRKFKYEKASSSLKATYVETFRTRIEIVQLRSQVNDLEDELVSLRELQPKPALVDETVPMFELRTIPIDEARILITEYVKEHYGASTTDIILELDLDVRLVLNILKELYENEEILEVES